MTEQSPCGPLQRIVRPQLWLAEVNQYGYAKLLDGPHDNRNGVEKAATILRRLGLAGSRKLVAAEVIVSELTGQHDSVNDEAIETLNAIGLRPNAGVQPPPADNGG